MPRAPSLLLLIALLAPATPAFASNKIARTPVAEQLGRGVHLLWSGDPAAARRELRPLVEPPPKGPGSKLRNLDYALYNLAQAELLSDDPAAALPLFERVAAMKSRFAAVSAAR